MSMDIDTTNKFLTAVRGDEIVVGLPGRMMRLSVDDALLAAAWLVANAEVIRDDARSRFNDVLDAVENA